MEGKKKHKTKHISEENVSRIMLIIMLWFDTNALAFSQSSRNGPSSFAWGVQQSLLAFSTFPFSFWNYTARFYTTRFLHIWPPFTMCPLLIQKRVLHRVGLWLWFCWRPAFFDWFSCGPFDISTKSPSPSFSLTSWDESFKINVNVWLCVWI